MTKSRTARFPLLALAAAAWPAPALADPPRTAEETIRAYDQWYEEATGTRPGAAGPRARCRSGAEDDDIVVCGRASDDTYRVPYEPVEGQVRRAAGDIPTGGTALSADRCMRACLQPVLIPIIPTIQALARGLDRILHPD